MFELSQLSRLQLPLKLHLTRQQPRKAERKLESLKIKYILTMNKLFFIIIKLSIYNNLEANLEYSGESKHCLIYFFLFGFLFFGGGKVMSLEARKLNAAH